jgi:predicted RNase H-like HicB family nuclease
MKKNHLIRTKYGSFQVSIWYDKRDKAYLVETHGFDKTMTFGRSIMDAKHMARDLIEMLVESAMDEGNIVIDSAMRVIGRKVRPESVLQLQHA